MSRKKENIARYSDTELATLRAKGQTFSDWRAAAAKPAPDGDDPDDALALVDWAMTELPLPKRKHDTNLRLDADVLAFFRRQRPSYQTRINAVLRAYVDQVSRGASS